MCQLTQGENMAFQRLWCKCPSADICQSKLRGWLQSIPTCQQQTFSELRSLRNGVGLFHNESIWINLLFPQTPNYHTNTTEPAYKVKNALSIPNTPEPTTTQEPLVGSQKRKARKTKITHLVRTADGRVSPAGGTLGKKRKCLDRKDQSKQGTIVASVARKWL